MSDWFIGCRARFGAWFYRAPALLPRLVRLVHRSGRPEPGDRHGIRLAGASCGTDRSCSAPHASAGSYELSINGSDAMGSALLRPISRSDRGGSALEVTKAPECLILHNFRIELGVWWRMGQGRAAFQFGNDWRRATRIEPVRAVGLEGARRGVACLSGLCFWRDSV
jgi:hypothetical protein